MTKILITRPEAAAKRIAGLLAAVGYEVLLEPILTITSTYQTPPSLEDLEGVIITSQNAFAVIDNKNPVFMNLFSLPCFCVGERTEEAAKVFGFHKTFYTSGNSATLAGYVAKNLPNVHKLLHISGDDVATTGFGALEHSGCKIINWAVYKAEAACSLTSNLQQQLRDGQISAAMFFSPRTSQLFIRLLAQYKLQACCERITAIGLSDAVAEALRTISWQRIEIAKTPTETAMITSLQHCCPAA